MATLLCVPCNVLLTPRHPLPLPVLLVRLLYDSDADSTHVYVLGGTLGEAQCEELYRNVIETRYRKGPIDVTLSLRYRFWPRFSSGSGRRHGSRSLLLILIGPMRIDPLSSRTQSLVVFVWNGVSRLALLETNDNKSTIKDSNFPNRIVGNYCTFFAPLIFGTVGLSSYRTRTIVLYCKLFSIFLV